MQYRSFGPSYRGDINVRAERLQKAFDEQASPEQKKILHDELRELLDREAARKEGKKSLGEKPETEADKPASAMQEDEVPDGPTPADEFEAGKYFSQKAFDRADTGYKSRRTIVEMDIQDFLRMAERLDQARPSSQADVAAAVAGGQKFSDLPILSFSNDGKGTATVVGHEGRHRAMELEALGETKIPVILESVGGQEIRWSEQGDAAGFDRVRGAWPKDLVTQNEGSDDSIPFPVQDPLAKEDEVLEEPTPELPSQSLETNGTIKEFSVELEAEGETWNATVQFTDTMQNIKEDMSKLKQEGNEETSNDSYFIPPFKMWTHSVTFVPDKESGANLNYEPITYHDEASQL